MNRDDWWTDGYPHERTESGFCTTCGSSANEYHYRCIPKGGTRMSWYKICSRCDTKVHYDIVSDCGVHRCQCGREYRCVIPGWPVNGGKYEPLYWVEIFSWKRLKDWVTGK